MQPPPEMPLHQVRKSATALANLLDDNREEQVLKEACLGLCQLFGEGIQNDRIQAILEANVVPKLVALLRPSKFRSVPISVQSAALQVLGNVACGDDRQTQVVIDSDALPCLRALLSSSDRGIRKEVCWIVSNITESSHQVQDVLDADILPPLLKLLDNQDTACREDATWVLFNLSSNRNPLQISYLAEKNGVRALCNLLSCPKDLDVIWKGCGTVAAVALKGLRNILISGQAAGSSSAKSYNDMAALVADAYGVERIEALTNHDAPDVRNRARLILERIFGTEPTSAEYNSFTGTASRASSTGTSTHGHAGCSCAFQPNQSQSATGQHYDNKKLYELSNNLSAHAINSAHLSSIGADQNLRPHLQQDRDLVDGHGSSSASSTDSDPEDDDSDSDLIPPPAPPCSCSLCTDTSPLMERRPRTKLGVEDTDPLRREGCSSDFLSICEFCSGGGRLGDGRAALASKLGRAVRLGHTHCLAILLSRMTWSQRVAATETPAILHPGAGPPDGGVGNSLPALALAAQLGKHHCLALLLRKCRPDLDSTYGKKRLTALGCAAQKSYIRCSQLLIEHGASAGTRCGDGNTALHLAASGGGHLGICRLLIEHNAPVNARSSKRQTPLCVAAQKGSSKIVRLLLEHGANANNEDEGKYTPLHLAASEGYEQCVDLLLKHRARVDAVTRKGVTPLYYAVLGGHAAIVRLLIAAGADANHCQKSLLIVAADQGNLEVVRILLNAQVPINAKSNVSAMLNKETEISDYLCPLHLAASKAHHEVVELLLNQGANVNEVTDKCGWSALDFAVLNGHAKCAVTLLEHGAVVTDNCKSISRNNWTLVQYAAHHGAKDIVRLLVQRLKEQSEALTEIESSALPTKKSDIPILKTSGETVDAGESVNASFNVNFSLNNGLASTNETVPSDTMDYLDDDGCEQENFINQDKTVPQPAHRYDPRSLDGDEVGFGTGPGYSNTAPDTPSSKSKRRIVKDDKHSTIRAREMKKRESDANDARGRLEEAINLRSVSKLTEAIAHVSKLVLHLATNTGSDVNGNGPCDSLDGNGFDSLSNDSGSCRGSALIGSASSGTNVKNTSSNNTGTYPSSSPLPRNSNGFTAPLSMEVGLGNEVQKARRILAGLLAEEKRVREEKEKEVADSKRESSQQMVRKAMKIVKDGGDPRSLQRAIARATRTVLDKDEDIVVQATTVSDLISNLEKRYTTIKSAMRDRDLETLSDVLPRTASILSELKKKGGDGASQRAFGGGDPNKVLGEGEKLKKELQEKRERAIQEERKAKDLERNAKDMLEAVMKTKDIVALELATKEASEVLLSKNSELGSTIEAAKKALSKSVKGERRKLKQARNTSDPDVIEKTAEATSKLGLVSLKPDVDEAKAHARMLREQAEAKKILSEAIVNSDTTTLNDIRNRLTKLGMFAEAEKARAEAERLQRAKRARSLLEGSIEDAKKSRDLVANAISLTTKIHFSDNDQSSYGTNEKNNFRITKEHDVLTEFVTWSWPDAQRLHEFSERAKKHGQSSSTLCSTADDLVKELACLGRQVLDFCVHSNDAQAIASMIAGYERSFISVSNPDVFDRLAGEKAISNAKQRLANVQSMDQERVKAESAQVKVEYAIATSRRAAAVRLRESRPPSKTVSGMPENEYPPTADSELVTGVSNSGNNYSCSPANCPEPIENIQHGNNQHTPRYSSIQEVHHQSINRRNTSASVDTTVHESTPNSLVPTVIAIARAPNKTSTSSAGHRTSARLANIDRTGPSISRSQPRSSTSNGYGGEASDGDISSRHRTIKQSSHGDSTENLSSGSDLAKSDTQRFTVMKKSRTLPLLNQQKAVNQANNNQCNTATEKNTSGAFSSVGNSTSRIVRSSRFFSSSNPYSSGVHRFVGPDMSSHYIHNLTPHSGGIVSINNLCEGNLQSNCLDRTLKESFNGDSNRFTDCRGTSSNAIPNVTEKECTTTSISQDGCNSDANVHYSVSTANSSAMPLCSDTSLLDDMSTPFSTRNAATESSGHNVDLTPNPNLNGLGSSRQRLAELNTQMSPVNSTSIDTHPCSGRITYPILNSGSTSSLLENGNAYSTGAMHDNMIVDPFSHGLNSVGSQSTSTFKTAHGHRPNTPSDRSIKFSDILGPKTAFPDRHHIPKCARKCASTTQLLGISCVRSGSNPLLDSSGVNVPISPSYNATSSLVNSAVQSSTTTPSTDVIPTQVPLHLDLLSTSQSSERHTSSLLNRGQAISPTQATVQSDSRQMRHQNQINPLDHLQRRSNRPPVGVSSGLIIGNYPTVAYPINTVREIRDASLVHDVDTNPRSTTDTTAPVVDASLSNVHCNDVGASNPIDLGRDFESENFGFDINSIIDDNPPPSVSEGDVAEMDTTLSGSAVSDSVVDDDLVEGLSESETRPIIDINNNLVRISAVEHTNETLEEANRIGLVNVNYRISDDLDEHVCSGDAGRVEIDMNGKGGKLTGADKCL